MYLLASQLVPEDIKPLIKAGLLSNELALTDKGVRILLSLAFKNYRKELVEVAKEQLADEEAKKAE